MYALYLCGLLYVVNAYSNPPPHTHACTATNIENGDVSSCICSEGTNSCGSCPILQYGLKACNTVCSSVNKVCTACDIYYSQTCDCLQTQKCIFGKPWNGKGKPPIWILRQLQANLISSPVLNMGIEELSKMPDKDDGWVLGLNNMNKKSQGLTMNSKHSRSRNQIHIHICPKNKNAEKTLSALDQSLYSSFNSVPGTNWYCKNANNGFTISSDVVSFLNKGTVSIDSAGIGVLTDSKGRLWNCISTSGAAEYIFCN